MKNVITDRRAVVLKHPWFALCPNETIFTRLADGHLSATTHHPMHIFDILHR